MCTDNLSYYLTCIDIMAVRFLDLTLYELVNNLKKHKMRFISNLQNFIPETVNMKAILMESVGMGSLWRLTSLAQGSIYYNK